MLQKIVAITFLTLTVVLNLLFADHMECLHTMDTIFFSRFSGASTSLMFDKASQKVVNFIFITLETGQ